MTPAPPAPVEADLRRPCDSLGIGSRDCAHPERRFRVLVENAFDAISLYTAEGVALYHSPTGLRILGRPEGYGIGLSILEDVHPEDTSLVRERFAEVCRQTD